jgi:hypothetical protein
MVRVLCPTVNEGEKGEERSGKKQQKASINLFDDVRLGSEPVMKRNEI